VIAVAAASVLVLLAVLLLPGAAQAIRGDTATAVAAERIDVAGPAVPVQVVSSFENSSVGDDAVAAVLADLQDFWSAELSAAGRPALTVPTGGYVSMDSTAPNGSALCINDPSLIAGNAFYCPAEDGIVFDSSSLVPVLLGRYGSAALAAAFAHEFGHAVQAQVGPTPADRRQDPDRFPAILIEAQADCDAGAFLAWASSGAAERVHIPAESLVRAVAPLLDFRDPATTSPDASTAHGLGLDRLSFVLIGFRGGAGACPAMTVDDLALTLGRDGVTSSPPSTLPRYSSTAAALDAAAASVTEFAAGLGLPGDPAAASAAPADLALAAPLGQFAAAAAVALTTGESITGSGAGAACFTGAWTASVFGRAGVDELGSWPTDADEAMDLIRSRPGAGFADLAGYADGFHGGWAACG
jgi:predicted metalloprotease